MTSSIAVRAAALLACTLALSAPASAYSSQSWMDYGLQRAHEALNLARRKAVDGGYTRSVDSYASERAVIPKRIVLRKSAFKGRLTAKRLVRRPLAAQAMNAEVK